MHRVRGSGALDDALAIANTYVEEAIRALSTLPEGPGRDALEELAHAVVERTS